jgi:hypothetical protein
VSAHGGIGFGKMKEIFLAERIERDVYWRDTPTGRTDESLKFGRTKGRKRITITTSSNLISRDLDQFRIA